MSSSRAAEMLIAVAVGTWGIVFAYSGFSGWLAMQHFPHFYADMGIEPAVRHDRLFWRGVLGCALVLGGLTYICMTLYLTPRRHSA